MVSVKPKIDLSTAENAGPDKGILRKTWEKVILAETQLELISTLVDRNLGFADIEEFMKTQEGKLKSTKFQLNSNVNEHKIKLLMKTKLADAQEKFREAKKDQDCMRKDLDKIYGPNSRKCKNI